MLPTYMSLLISAIFLNIVKECSTQRIPGTCLDCLGKVRSVDGCIQHPTVGTLCGPFRMTQGFYSDCQLFGFTPPPDGRNFRDCALNYNCSRGCVEAYHNQFAAHCLRGKRRLDPSTTGLTCADYGRIHGVGINSCGLTDSQSTKEYLRDMVNVCGCNSCAKALNLTTTTSTITTTTTTTSTTTTTTTTTTAAATTAITTKQTISTTTPIPPPKTTPLSRTTTRTTTKQTTRATTPITSRPTTVTTVPPTTIASSTKAPTPSTLRPTIELQTPSITEGTVVVTLTPSATEEATEVATKPLDQAGSDTTTPSPRESSSSTTGAHLDTTVTSQPSEAAGLSESEIIIAVVSAVCGILVIILCAICIKLRLYQKCCGSTNLDDSTMDKPKKNTAMYYAEERALPPLPMEKSQRPLTDQTIYEVYEEYNEEDPNSTDTSNIELSDYERLSKINGKNDSQYSKCDKDCYSYADHRFINRGMGLSNQPDTQNTQLVGTTAVTTVDTTTRGAERKPPKPMPRPRNL